MEYAKFRLRSFTALESRYSLDCGSYYELPIKYTAANVTDTDGMHYYYDICAIPWNRNPPKNTKCTVLRIDSKQTPPGFAKLMIDRDNMGYNPTYFRRPPVLRDIKTGGPSQLIEQKLEFEDRAPLELKREALDNDRVYAVYCPYWPVEAEEWRKRKRFHGWPNEKLITRITKGGCHFVSKLRTWSSCDDTEWRFSFSKAELLLIHSWTPDQKLAYHAIRVIKRKISESCAADGSKGFQTYYFKTLMLWTCEEFASEFWSEQNLTTCVRILLLRFLRCLHEKFCPSYFISECNIMSHLKDEGSFEKELQALQMFLTNGIVSNVPICPYLSVAVHVRTFEYNCFATTNSIFPLYEKLNGRCAQYLSECEWFLPEMKNLHAAIEANIRLMSVNSVTERQASKDYVDCLENFDLALLKREVFESYNYANADMSNPENWIRIFVRKLLRNSVAVYRREDYRCNEPVNTFMESYPSNLYCVTSAYRANFYFTAMKSYSESVSECEKCFEVVNHKTEGRLIYRHVSELTSLVICNSLSQIFDEHLRVILGFVTLHRNISSSSSPIFATSHEVCLKLNSWTFLKYVYIQCQQKLNSVKDRTVYSYFIIPCLYRPEVSQLTDDTDFSEVILFAALRQSRAYKKSIKELRNILTILVEGNKNH